MNLVIGGQGERWQASRFLAIMSVASLCLQCSINVSFSAVLISAFWRRRRARSCSFYAPLHTFAPDSKRNASYDASLMRLAVRWTGADKCGTESTVWLVHLSPVRELDISQVEPTTLVGYMTDVTHIRKKTLRQQNLKPSSTTGINVTQTRNFVLIFCLVLILVLGYVFFCTMLSILAFWTTNYRTLIAFVRFVTLSEYKRHQESALHRL